MMLGEITRLLQGEGVLDAPLAEAMPALFDEMAKIARHALAQDTADHTLATGTLVNEAYARLSAQDGSQWRNRGHFLSIAAMVMRRILIGRAQARVTARPASAGMDDVSVRDGEILSDAQALEVLQVDQLLEQFAAFAPRAAQVVECRFFGGLSIADTAEALNLSPETVEQEWVLARAWLKQRLRTFSAPD